MLIKLGDRGESVREVQRRLIEWGAPITLDGVFGSETAEWVFHLQRWKQLEADSIVGPQTTAVLDAAPDGVIPDLSRRFRIGDVGEGVSDTQQRLIEWGAPIRNTGRFDAQMALWLVEFQDWQELAVDGVAGPATLSALALHPTSQIPNVDNEVRPGDNGEAVRRLQERLIGWGAPISADGDFGPNTEQWVTRFQQWKGLTIDGVVGPKTDEALAKQVGGVIPDLSTTLRSGDDGEAVRRLQERLIAWGAAIGADGDFGSNTEQWVTRFQRWKGLTPDGVAGQSTLRALAYLPSGSIPEPVQVIRRGDEGPAVVAIQRRLIAWGAPISADGDFGPNTEQWVTRFQEWKNLAANGIVDPATKTALDATPDGRIPAPSRGPGSRNGEFTARAAAEIVSHEGFVREAYKDSVGVWTWSVGITAGSGHNVRQYIDNPQSPEQCFAVFKTILENNYIPAVRSAFEGYPLTETELAAAVSFHYNTGAIGRASWVGLVKAGNKSAARDSIMRWRTPSSIIPRREKERDLFFDGRWSSDGTVPEYPVRKPSYSPDFGNRRLINVLPVMEELFPAVAESTERPEVEDGPPVDPDLTTEFVTASSLNVRSEPRVSAGNIRGVATVATPVGVVRQVDERWVEVECEADWSTSGPAVRRGFVSSRFLREPAPDSVERLVAAARTEWLRFDKGTGREAADPYFRYVGEMWRALGVNLDGRNTDVPWSAAAISFVVRNAGKGYEGFQFSVGHWKYINDAIADRELERGGPFLGFRLSEQKPKVGDLVARWRRQRQTYDSAFRKSQAATEAQQSYTSHTDLVVAVNDTSVLAMGGNVQNTFYLDSYALDSRGFLRPSRNVFALLQNNTG